MIKSSAGALHSGHDFLLGPLFQIRWVFRKSFRAAVSLFKSAGALGSKHDKTFRTSES